MASITPNNGRSAFVAAWDPHTYWELNSTNLGTNYGDDTSGNDDNTNVASGDISTQESYDGMSNQNDPPSSGWFDIYTVTDAAMLLYIPSGLTHLTSYGLWHNGGGTHAQGMTLRATTTGVEIGVTHNASGTSQDALVHEIPDADLPGWFVVSGQYSSEGGAQGDMGMWINGTKVRNGTRGTQLSYGSGNPDFGMFSGDPILTANILDGPTANGDWSGSEVAITSSGILIANFTCDNPNQTNTTPAGNGDTFHSDYYDDHTATTDPSYDQTSFRAKNDTGGETSTDWKAALNTNWNQVQDENVRVRFLIQEDDDAAATGVGYQLEYNLDSGGWNDVTGSSNVVRASASGNITDGVATTSQLGSGTFLAGQIDESDGEAGNVTFTTTANQETEVEFCIQVRGADTDRGDTIQLRVTVDDDTALDTYTSTPTMTVPLGAGMQMATATKLQASAAAENPAAFDFDNSLPWGAISLALRQEAGTATLSMSPTTKFSTIQTTGTVTVQDGATIDELAIIGDVVLADVLDLTDVTIDGDLDIADAGTYDFSNVTVTGDVTNSDATGNATINASDGSVLSTSEPGTGNGLVNILNAVTVSVTVYDADGSGVVNGARVYIEADTGGPLTAGTVILNTTTNVSGTASTDTFNYTADQPITGWSRKGTVSPLYQTGQIAGTITTGGFTDDVVMIDDE